MLTSLKERNQCYHKQYGDNLHTAGLCFALIAWYTNVAVPVELIILRNDEQNAFFSHLKFYDSMKVEIAIPKPNIRCMLVFGSV